MGPFRGTHLQTRMQTFLHRDEISKESALRMWYDAMIFLVHASHDSIFDVLYGTGQDPFSSLYSIKNNGIYLDRRARIGAHHARVLRTK